jgi:hypothetical protein
MSCVVAGMLDDDNKRAKFCVTGTSYVGAEMSYTGTRMKHKRQKLLTGTSLMSVVRTRTW